MRENRGEFLSMARETLVRGVHDVPPRETGSTASGATANRTFLPLYRTQHQWKDGSRVMVDLPLFPGYVFVRVDWSNRVSVLGVPGVVSMIGTAMRPAPLPDFEVEKLRAGLNPLRAEPHPLITVGQRVRIKSGLARRS